MTVTYDCIATQTLANSTTGTVTFNSIPGTYTDLLLIINGGKATTTGFGNAIRFNNDTGSNYSTTGVVGAGSSAGSYRFTNSNMMYLGISASNALNATHTYHIMNYSNTTTNKTLLSREGTADLNVYHIVGLWRSTSAITRIDISPEFTANWFSGSTFSLYGIKAE